MSDALTWEPHAAARMLAIEGMVFPVAQAYGLTKTAFLNRLRGAGIDPVAVLREGRLGSDDTQGGTAYQASAAPSEWVLIGATADIHEGSANCDRRAFRAFQRKLYERGGRVHVIAGDAIDGTYSKRGGQHDQSHVGIERQTQALLDDLEQRPGLQHFVIGGNHGATYHKASGVPADVYIERAAIAAGRSDVTACGMTSGTVAISGYPTIEPVHYRTGKYRAPLMWLAMRAQDTLPDVLVGGHYHIYDVKCVRGVTCVQPGAYQAETDFMGGSVDYHPVGGTFLWCQRDRGRWRILPELITADAPLVGAI